MTLSFPEFPLQVFGSDIKETGKKGHCQQRNRADVSECETLESSWERGTVCCIDTPLWKQSKMTKYSHDEYCFAYSDYQ